MIARRTPRTLLIVDDDPVVTETFSRMLKLEGYDIRTANSADDGLREAQTRSFDAIVLDLRMPLSDGLAFLQRLRAGELDRVTPVMIVTGDYFLDDDLMAELGRLGAEVRFKPMWLEDLVDVARTLVGSATTRASRARPPVAALN
jgi:DNA-binding response OmpR family regulator